jgi:6,7-dimethyl-8-ribityllumazine synthase
MELAVRHSVPVGNGILTCENKEQALTRARGGKGGDAARACFSVIELARSLQEQVS